MPIDPGIIGQLQIPAPAPSPEAAMQHAAQVQEAQIKRQQIVQSMRDDAILRATLQQSVDPASGQPDYDKWIGMATSRGASPAGIEKAQGVVDTHRKAVQDALEKNIKNQQAGAELTGQLVPLVTDQSKLDALRSMLNPESAKLLPPTYDEFAQNADRFTQAGMASKDQAELKMKALDEWRKAQEFSQKSAEFAQHATQGLAGFLSLETTPEGQAHTLAVAKQQGIPDSVIASVQGKTPDELKQMALTAEQREQGRRADTTEARMTANEAATRAQEAQRIAIERGHLGIAQAELKLKQQAAVPLELKTGTPAYRQAQDLSDGTLTFQDFQRLHSRAQADAPLRAAIYDTARSLNPNFNPAAFEIGYKFASNPKVKQQIASIKNVESGVDDLLKFSDAATRSGSPTLNQYAIQPIKTAIGSKQYSNFKTAVTAFADELSGALGYGSATDMSREMGFSMTDMSQSPANFKSNIENVVVPFVARKKVSILGQMGQYAGTAEPPTPSGPKEGAQKPITLPGYPAGAMQEFRGGQWVRIK